MERKAAKTEERTEEKKTEEKKTEEKTEEKTKEDAFFYHLELKSQRVETAQKSLNQF